MKDNIIDRAFGLFLNQSYEAVSISDISKAIGVTKGALYHHFLNKEDLFKAVIDKYLIIKDLDYIDEAITLKEHIQQTINKASLSVQHLFNNNFPFVPINYISLFIDAFRHYPGFAEDKENLFGRIIENNKLVMDNAVRRREIRDDIDTSTMAINMFSITIGIASNFFCHNSPESSIKILQSQMNEFYKVLQL
ncbi:MAG: TetR/AcrR family transcriptional regulator [Bacteroidetes bacterium]|nr:TetR/AcrR family transcriptional regulator [Bacteroidota bacterium]